MTPPPGPHPDLFLAHAGSLRALARSLLRDPHAAEDVLQETFVRALERPPASLERVGAWLRTVLESVVHKKLRAEGRRALRERESARSECSASEEPQRGEVLRGEVLRAVLESVLALDEPYRELVLDRYFEGLPAREIARRRGLPLNTVTSRLARARTRLRERLVRELGEEAGGWRASLSALFGLPILRPREIPIALIPGVLVVSTKVKLIATSALIAFAAIGLWMREDRAIEPAADPQAPIAAIVPSEGASRAESTSARVIAAAEKDQREVLGSAPPLAPTRKLPPYRYELNVHARDSEDRPVANAVVWIAPPGAGWNRAGLTNAQGDLEFALRAFRPSLDLALSVRAGIGSGRVTRRFTASSGAPNGLACGLPDAGKIQVWLSAPEGEEEGTNPWESSHRVHSFLARNLVSSDVPELVDGPDAAVFVEPVLGAVRVGETTKELDRRVEAQLFATAYGSSMMEGSPGGGAVLLSVGEFTPTFDELPEDDESRLPSARGFVRNGAGRALKGLRVEARSVAGEVIAGTWTNEDGEYRLAVEGDERITLYTGGGEHGLAMTEWEPALANELRWSPVLDRGHELLGCLKDERGEPLAGWVVEVELDDATEPWWDLTTTGEDGRFAIPNLPQRGLRLLTRPTDAKLPLASIVVEEVWPDLAERVFEVGDVALAQGSISIAVTDDFGKPIESADLRLWQESSGRGCAVGSGDDPGAYIAQGLPPGDYLLEIGDDGHEHVEPAGFRLAPGEELDLGSVRLPAMAELVLSAPGLEADAASIGLSLWRVADETEWHVLELDALPDGPIPLREGSYELAVTLGELHIARRFRLRAGGRHELELGLPEPPAEVR